MKGRAASVWTVVVVAILFGLGYTLGPFRDIGQASVVGAGELQADGFYIGISEEEYRRPKLLEPLAKLPDLLDYRLLSKLRWTSWGLISSGDAENWALVRGGDVYYVVKDVLNGKARKPPERGWQVEGVGTSPAPSLHGVLPLQGQPSDWWTRASPTVQQAISTPATTLLLAVILYYAYRIWADRLSAEQVAFSYNLVVRDKEYWRVFSASFAHLDLLHLLFNCMSVWALGGLETRFGTLAYGTMSLELVVLTMLVNLLLYKLTAWARGRPQQLSTRAVGYSCVLFSWIVVQCIAGGKYCPIAGVPKLCFKTYNLPLPPPLNPPINLAPIFLLVFTSLLMHNASFIGHLSGIILGYLLAWDLLPLPSPLLTAAVSTAIIFTHERLWPWQPFQPDPGSSPSAPSPLPHTHPLALLLLLQVTIGALSFTVLHSLTAAGLTAGPLFVMCSLRKLPSPRALVLSLPLEILIVLLAVLWLPVSLARSRLYATLGLFSNTQLTGHAVLATELCVSLPVVALLVIQLNKSREGAVLLKALKLDLSTESGSEGLLPVGMPAPERTVFSGVGRALGRRTGPQQETRQPTATLGKQRLEKVNSTDGRAVELERLLDDEEQKLVL